MIVAMTPRLFLTGLVVSLAASGAQLERTNLLAYADDNGQVMPARSVGDWQKRRDSVLRAMQTVMGPLPGREKRCALELKVEEETDAGTYVLRRITYSSEPNGRVPAYLLIPKTALAG